MLQNALNGVFLGWKGGEFNYQLHTPVNFEKDPSSYSGETYIIMLMLNALK